MGSISRMNTRERMFEENKELMSKLEAIYEKIGVKETFWDDNMEPYVNLMGKLPTSKPGLDFTVTLIQFYCDGDFVDEEAFTDELERDLSTMRDYVERHGFNN